MSERIKTEPTAEMRQAANGCWQLFTALGDEGFTDQQALVIIGQMLTASIGKGGGDQ